MRVFQKVLLFLNLRMLGVICTSWVNPSVKVGFVPIAQVICEAWHGPSLFLQNSFLVIKAYMEILNF